MEEKSLEELQENLNKAYDNLRLPTDPQIERLKLFMTKKACKEIYDEAKAYAFNKKTKDQIMYRAREPEQLLLLYLLAQIDIRNEMSRIIGRSHLQHYDEWSNGAEN